ncbi:MAG: hypothetical protein FH748_13705 [Balneolaceae bacterium]|nr:hypothetical protein [Balneolaceae bacterium]
MLPIYKDDGSCIQFYPELGHFGVCSIDICAPATQEEWDEWFDQHEGWPEDDGGYGDDPCGEPGADCGGDSPPGDGSDGGGVDTDYCPEGQVEGPDGECVDDTGCKISTEDVSNAFPAAPPDAVMHITAMLNNYAEDFGLDTKEEMQHFLAQSVHESGSFSSLEEGLGYRVEKLGTVDFRKYFNPTSNPNADPNKENPYDYAKYSGSTFVDQEKLAIWVYDDKNRGSRYKLGNNAPGDGYKYRGRGIIQLTGKELYSEFNAFYRSNYDSSVDILSNPDLLSTNYEIAAISALWYYETRVLPKIDVNASVEEITKLVNGGKKGLGACRTF